MKVNAKGIRANVKSRVTVYELKRGCPKFGRGVALSVRCSFFRIVVVREPGMKVKTRRVKIGQSTEKAV